MMVCGERCGRNPERGEGGSAVSVAVDVDQAVDEVLSELFDDVFETLVLDDDVTTFETVIAALMAVCGHARPAAERLTWKVHTEGLAVVFAGTLDEAEAVASALRSHSLRVQVRSVNG